MRYLLNAPVLTGHGVYRLGPPSEEQLGELVARPFLSGVGHPATARWLSRRLGVDVPCCRRSISMRPGDSALVLRLLRRLPEGRVLDLVELASWPQEFAWLECLPAIACPAASPRENT